MIDIEKTEFGEYCGEKIFKYSIKNKNDFCVNILNYGGIITEILVKDKNSKLKNVVLGYKNFENYIGNAAYAGMIVGRTAGRIENAEFVLNNKKYILYKNNEENSLHGGKNGLSNKIFDVCELSNGIELSYKSLHLEEGYPGEVIFKIKYLVSEENELILEYEAVSDRDTYINLTNHSYFNLSGNLEKNGDEQILKIRANRVCELKENLIPTGKTLDVEKTIFDFREGMKIKDGIQKGQNERNSQFEITGAYDHPFIFENSDFTEPKVILFSEYSGIKMEVFTDEKIAVIYTGNFLDNIEKFDSTTNEKHLGKNNKYLGVAIETQDYPNGINEKNFENRILKKGEKFFSKTIFKFSKNIFL